MKFKEEGWLASLEEERRRTGGWKSRVVWGGWMEISSKRERKEKMQSERVAGVKAIERVENLQRNRDRVKNVKI